MKTLIAGAVLMIAATQAFAETPEECAKKWNAKLTAKLPYVCTASIHDMATTKTIGPVNMEMSPNEAGDMEAEGVDYLTFYLTAQIGSYSFTCGTSKHAQGLTLSISSLENGVQVGSTAAIPSKDDGLWPPMLDVTKDGMLIRLQCQTR